MSSTLFQALSLSNFFRIRYFSTHSLCGHTISSNEIRDSFINNFRNKHDHTFVQSSPIVLASQQLLSTHNSSEKNLRSASEQMEEDEDAPIELPHNPYEKPCRICILCRYKVHLDYKNARLLQQFVSTFSGRVYDRHITGLCNPQHDALLTAISLSRRTGYMPIMVKDPKFLRDPKLFDPLRPIRPHSFE